MPDQVFLALSSILYYIITIMSRKKILTALFLVALLPGAAREAAASAKCGGRFFNPISDVDWRAMFPIKIGGVAVTPGEGTDTVSHFPLCFCGSPVPRVGIKVSFWEPVKLIEVVRHPGCFPSLGGRKLPLPSFATAGTYGEGGGQRGDRTSFLHVHHFLYPVFSVLSLFSSFGCMTQGGFDLAYMTAFDPLWSNDELSFLLHPEIALVANPAAQASCAADAVAAAGGFALNELFWCAGSWGSVYPHTGNNGATGDLPAVYALSAVKLLAKLHNELLAFKTTGEGSLCAPRPHRVIVKDQYKLQLAFPKNTQAFPIGRTTARWAPGKWYPGQGEDWVLVLWRKKDCCLL